MQTHTVVVTLAGNCTLWLPWSVEALELRRWVILVELAEIERMMGKASGIRDQASGKNGERPRVVRHGMAELSDEELRVLRN